MQAAFDLRGRTVVVTGAGAGIGRAAAEGFLRDGAAVVGCDVHEDRLTELAARGAITVKADVSDRAAVFDVIRRAHAETGRLDVLLNNAGYGARAAVADLPEGAFERMLAVHLFGMIYGLQAAIPVMRAQGGGRIINMLSRAAEASAATDSAYSAAKAGMWAAMRSAARECLADKILINGMIPGPTRTSAFGSDEATVQRNARVLGLDLAQLQPPEAVYPTIKLLATLPDDGPTGKVFWNEREYALMDPARDRPPGPTAQ